MPRSLVTSALAQLFLIALLCLLPACVPAPAAVFNAGESGNAGPVTESTSPETRNGGYASRVSVIQGESLDFHLSASGGNTATLRIYREGPTRQLMATLKNIPVAVYDCAGKYATGCDWPVATSFTVPANWLSGAYIVNMSTAGDARGKNFIFWVREKNPGSTARLLFLSSVNTHQAYNDFGGGSLYGLGDAELSPRVSFNRPFDGGLGKYKRWEAGAISWLEGKGYAVEYATTYDLHFYPDLLSHYDVAMIAGHSEYWTWEARRQLERFVNDGGRFLNLSGNVMWWQIRYEDDGRTLVGYKSWEADPEKDPMLNTGNPGDRPIFDNPLGLTGLYWLYGGYAPDSGGGYYVVNTDHWIFDGTGLQENQLIGKGSSRDTSVHDKESDGMPFNCAGDGSTILGPPGSSGSPRNFTVLGLTTANGDPRAAEAFAMMGIYTLPGGGAVFSAGTTGWATGLSFPAIDRMTVNIIDRFLAGDVPAEPDNPDANYFVYNRFNCHDVGRNRFESTTAWQEDIARYNFAAWTDNADGRLTTACGHAGSGLELTLGESKSYTALIRPNWGATDSLYSYFYLKLDGVSLADGGAFNLFEQYWDNRQWEPTPSMVLQLRRSGDDYQLRYQPADADLPWVVAPNSGFFLVETGWNRSTDHVGLWIDGSGYDETVSLATMPALNRHNLGIMRPTGEVAGVYCLDEFILDDARVDPPPDDGDPPTPTATPPPTPTPPPPPTPTPPPDSVDEILLISSTQTLSAGGVSADNEDILALDRTSGEWSIYFDGSDVGLASRDIDAFQPLGDGSLLLSLDAPLTTTGLGKVDDSDILRFIPGSLGAQTAGTFELYVDGSDIGLTTSSEDIDSIGLLPGGDLLIGALGKVTTGGITGTGADLLRLSLQQAGIDTVGTFSLYWDGSDVGLSKSSEKITAVWVDPVDGSLYLSTNGNFAVAGLAGLRGDIFVCEPGTTGGNTSCNFPSEVYWSAAGAGIGSIPLDGLSLIRAAD